MAAPKVIYNDFEENFLIELVQKYKSVLEDKKTDAKSILKKMSTWSTLTSEYNNETTVSSKRSTIQLKSKWKSMKAAASKKIAEERRTRRVTGGGSDAGGVSPRSVRVASLVSSQILSMTNLYDDDAAFLDGNEDRIPEPSGFFGLDELANTDRAVAIASGSQDVQNSESNTTQLENALVSKVLEKPGEPSGSNAKKIPVRLTATQSKIVDLAEKEHDVKMQILRKKLDTEELRHSQAVLEHDKTTEILQYQCEYWKFKAKNLAD